MAAYYNEHDKFAAAWLRELIKRDVIALGEVDERDIREVKAAELSRFTQCHFFAGIGVWSYSLRQAGWADTKRVWTGSCPCQPFSVSGIRKAAQDERHLWPVWFPLVRESKPVVIFGEQVASDDGLAWLDVVSFDLENAGYTCGAVDTCAAGFGAPQISQRLYFVAEVEGERCGETRTSVGQSTERAGDGGEFDGMATTADTRCDGTGEHAGGSSQLSARSEQCGDIGELAEANRGRCKQWNQGQREVSESDTHSTDGELGAPQSKGLEGYIGNVRNGNESRRDETEQARSSSGAGEFSDMGTPTGERFNGITQCSENTRESSIKEWGQFGRFGATNGFWSNAEWIPCRDGKARPVEPGTFPLAYGATARVGRLRGYGNALVAPQAIAFIKAYMSLRGTDH